MNESPDNGAMAGRAARSKCAAVLILALWTLLVLGLLAVAVGGHVSAALMTAEHLQRSVVGRCLAEAGVARAISVLLADTNGWDSLTEPWSNNPAQFRQPMACGGSFTVRHTVTSSDGRGVEIGYGVADEERRVNLNLASPTLLRSLFCRLGGVDEASAQELVSAIREYWDVKNKLLLTDSAARGYYSLQGEPAVRFESEYEMLLVKKVTPELFARIERFTTIHGSGKLNFNTIEPVIVECLVGALRPNSEATAISLARKLAAFRAKGGQITEPAVTEAVRQIERVVELTAEERSTLSQIMAQFGTIRATCFRGEAVGSIHGNGREDSRIAFVYDRDRKVLTHWRVY